jgi:methyl-accepting chemotaxis protein
MEGSQMNWFQNRKTSQKIAMLVTLMTILTVLVGGIGFRQLHNAEQDMNRMYEDTVLPIGSLNQLQNASRGMEKGLMQYVGTSATESQESIAQAMEAQRAELTGLVEAIGASQMDEKSSELLAQIKETLTQYTTEMVPFLQQIVSGGPMSGQGAAGTGGASAEGAVGGAAGGLAAGVIPGGTGGVTGGQNNAAQPAGTIPGGVGAGQSEAPPAAGENGPRFEAGQEQLAKLGDAIQELTVYNTEKAKQATLQMKETTSKASRNILLLIAASAFVSAAFGWWIARQLSVPIRRIAGVAEQVAAGNLKVEPLRLQRTDELGELGGSVDRMLASLKVLINRLSESTGVVEESSRVLLDQAVRTEEAGQAISEAVRHTDEGARQQSIQILHMTGTLQEMAAAIKMTAASGEAAATASSRSAERAEAGLGVIGKAMTDMESVCQEIQKASIRMTELDREAAHISDIARFISEIASQTNLLALNASIEAARAGEHGRGFAVVAEEVRKLAEESRMSSERATDSVKLLRKGTQEAADQMRTNALQAEAGMKAALAAGAMFKEIAAEVDSVSELMTDLSAAVEEAFAGSEEIVSQAESLKDIAEGSLELSERAAHQAGETVSAMKEIRGFSERLDRESAELAKAMNTFTF